MQYKCYDGQYSIQENNQTYKIVFISYGISNAFAVPGNQIFFTSSMIKEFKNQEEFFMVLAHEIGHHHHQHHKKSFLLNFLLEFIMSIFSPSNTDSLNQIIKMLASGQFSKKDELEADQYSVNMLKKYQVDIKKASSFFKRLDQKEGSLSKWMNLTHPDHQDRFKLFHDVQQNVPFKQYLTDMEWNKIKSMCSY
jgi:predicted Zn-dependent protease